MLVVCGGAIGSAMRRYTLLYWCCPQALKPHAHTLVPRPRPRRTEAPPLCAGGNGAQRHATV